MLVVSFCITFAETFCPKLHSESLIQFSLFHECFFEWRFHQSMQWSIYQFIHSSHLSFYCFLFSDFLTLCQPRTINDFLFSFPMPTPDPDPDPDPVAPGPHRLLSASAFADCVSDTSPLNAAKPTNSSFNSPVPDLVFVGVGVIPSADIEVPPPLAMTLPVLCGLP
jgi:hypothetical protein